MKMVVNVKEVFNSALEAEKWVEKMFNSKVEQEKAIKTIIENKKALGIYCYG